MCERWCMCKHICTYVRVCVCYSIWNIYIYMCGCKCVCACLSMIYNICNVLVSVHARMCTVSSIEQKHDRYVVDEKY